MKRILLPLLICSVALSGFATRAAVILSDDFSYADGSLITVSAGKWSTHSGTAGQADVAGGLLNLTQTEGEDVNATLDGAPYSATGSDVLYASFTASFSALPSGTGGYFAHFKDAGTSNFRGRIFATTTGAEPGKLRLGIASAGSTPATFGADLELGTAYRVVVRLTVASAAATLWVNPADEADANISSTDTGTALAISTFAFRQSLSGGNGMGTLVVDNLLVGTSFGDVVPAGAIKPSIINGPVSRTVTAGDSVTFTVTATGTAPLAYEWQHNGNVLATTTDTLTLNNVTTGQAGEYKVIVSNTAGSAESAPATLTVNAAPVAPTITQQPQSQTVNVGANVTFSVTATGAEPISYQWKHKGADLTGSTAATLPLNGVTAAQAGEYQVIVSNSAGSTPSDIVTLTVNEPTPTITKIAELHKMLDPVTWRPTNTVTLFTVEGIVTTHVNLTTTSHGLFYIQDDTGGIAVFHSGAANVVPPAGAKVRVTGPLTDFNGLLELGPNVANAATSVTTLSTGNPLPAPTVLDLAQFATPDPTIIEPIEGKRVQVSDVTLDLTNPTFNTAGENVTVTDAIGNTFVLRVDTRTDIIGQAKPAGPVTIIGVLGQFDGSNPRTSGYQIIPSRFADILSAAKAATVRYTNILENLVRPGDAPTNTFTEHALRTGEKLTMNIEVTDSEGRDVTVTTGAVPASASWNLSATTGKLITGTFTFTPTVADAGQKYVITLDAANGSAVNNSKWTIYVPTLAEQRVILGEYLANPATTNTAPHWNPLKRELSDPLPASFQPSTMDEYVEIVNLSGSDLDLLSWTISDATSLRHRFYESVSLTSSNAVIVYGGPLNGLVPVLEVPAIPASGEGSTPGLALNNDGDTITLRNADGNLIFRVLYNSAGLSSDGSMTRAPNMNGGFVAHSSVSTLRTSPGKQPDGSAYSVPAPDDAKPFNVTATAAAAGGVELKWTPEAGRTYSIHRANSVTGSFTKIANGLTGGEYTDAAVGNSQVLFYRVSTP